MTILSFVGKFFPIVNIHRNSCFFHSTFCIIFIEILAIKIVKAITKKIHHKEFPRKKIRRDKLSLGQMWLMHTKVIIHYYRSQVEAIR